MRTLLSSVLFLIILCPNANAGQDFTGMWFDCVPEMKGRRNPYDLLVIRQEGAKYVVVHEWGSPYSFAGTGTIKNKRLVVRGCSYYRGDTMSNCDPNNPPVAFKFKPTSYKSNPKSLDSDLVRGKTIKTDKTSWERLAYRCEELLNATEEEQIPSQK
jgi:hypothetical protein